MKSVIIILILLSTSSCCQTIENNIVLIDVGSLNRGEIGEAISKINTLNPAVISIDLTFIGYSSYEQDLQLLKGINECKNIVMVSAIKDFKEVDDDYNFKEFMYQTEPHFLLNAKTGFTNVINGNAPVNPLCKFSVYEKVNGKVEYHFAVQTAMNFDSLQTMNFVVNNPKIKDVDYKSGNRRFKIVSTSELRHGKVNKKDIEGKIIMLGYLGPSDEDKFFTPLNTNPDKPDMYGLEYLANIVAQVLEYKKA